MFKDFMINVVALSFLATACEMIMPDGSIKKYLKLIMGFMVMVTLLNPVLKNMQSPQEFEFSFEEFQSDEDFSAKSDAYILKLHEENIKNHIREKTGGDGEIFTELYSDGRVKEVTIRNSHIPLAVIEELKRELDCEKIQIINGDDNENQ